MYCYFASFSTTHGGYYVINNGIVEMDKPIESIEDIKEAEYKLINPSIPPGGSKTRMYTHARIISFQLLGQKN